MADASDALTDTNDLSLTTTSLSAVVGNDVSGFITSSIPAPRAVALPVRGSIDFTVTAALSRDKYRVRVMGSGFGLNYEFDDAGNRCQWFVPESALESCVDVFGGAKVHWDVNHSGEYDHADGWKPGNELGYISDLALVNGSLEATLHVHANVPDEIRQVIAAQRAGLSIEAHADRRPSIRDGKAVMELINFRHPPDRQATVALVTHPALEGEILRVAASRRDAMSAENKTADPVVEPAKSAGSDEAQKLVEAAQAQLDELKAEREKFAKEQAILAAKQTITASLAAEELPTSTHTLAEKTFHARIEAGQDVSVDEVKAFADEWRKEQRGTMTRGGESVMRVEVTADSSKKADVILSRMLLGSSAQEDPRLAAGLAKEFGKPLGEVERDMGMPVGAYLGPRKAFQLITGTDPAEWRTSNRARRQEIRASVGSSTLDDTYADRMHKVMMIFNETNPWRQTISQIARIISVSDFRNVDFVHKGLYGAIPTVAKGANYTALSSPTDRGHEFAVSKYGGTEDTTWEDIVNDDRGAIADVPRMLVDAYWRTQGQDVADLFTASNLSTGTGPDYDSGTPYCDAGRSNQGSTAFSDTDLNTVWVAMMKQADFFSSERLGLQPARLLHPVDIAKAVNDVFKPQGNDPGGETTDYSFSRSRGITPILIPHWTNTADHVYIANPAVFPSAVVAYLNGNADPTIDIQDNRTVGSWFDSDKLTWKISGVWGKDLVRHEGIYLNDV